MRSDWSGWSIALTTAVKLQKVLTQLNPRALRLDMFNVSLILWPCGFNSTSCSVYVQKFHTLQQRLQQVAVPTVSKATSGSGEAVATLPPSGPQKVGQLSDLAKKFCLSRLSRETDIASPLISITNGMQRICSDLDVHSNITTRSSSRLPSKRHKPASLAVPEPAASRSLSQAVSQSTSSAHAFDAPFIAILPRQHAIHCMASDSHPSAELIPAQSSVQQPACRPAAHQPLCLMSGNSAGLTVYNTRQQQATPRSFAGEASKMATRLATGKVQASSNRQAALAVGVTKASAAPVPPYSSSRQPLAAGQDIAAKMHVLQAHAMDIAWQQQQQAPATAQIRRGPAAPPPVDAGSSTCAQLASRTSRSAAMQGADGQNKLSCMASTAPQKHLELAARTPLPSEPLAEICSSQQHQQPHSSHQLETPTSCRSADLSADTESLVVKLRALSANRDANSQNSKGRTAHAAQQGFTYKAKAGKKGHRDMGVTPGGNTSCSTGPSVAAIHRTQRPHAAASAVTARSTAPLSRCSVHTQRQPQPYHPGQPGRCLLPHAHSIKQEELPQPAPASSTGQNRSCEASSSSALVTCTSFRQHGPVPQSSLASKATAPAHPSSTEDAAEVAACSDVHDAPVNSRLGKVTPLKGGFTPRPSRFRLEAERCSPMLHSRPDQLQQALFSSPVKEANMDPVSGANAGCVGPLDAHIAAAASASADHSRDYRAQNETAEPASDTMEGSTPADFAAASSTDTQSAVFSNMHFILDSNFLPDQQHR